MIIEFLKDILKESANLWLAVSPYLLLGMFIAGILHVFLGTDFIKKHLGGGTLSSILKATLFGIPLPICSCGVIPVAASLQKEGASRSATLSFLVSTPTTGVDSILATYSLMGPLFAVFRPLAAFLSGITVGIFNFIFNPEKKAKALSHNHSSVSSHFKLKEVLRYGFLELAEDIGKWLIIGVMIGGILTAIIPDDMFAGSFSNPFYHLLIVLVVAVPLYVCATGSIPIAAVLISKGFSPGAALVFLIAGPATNTVTLSFVRSRLGKRSFYIYLVSIVGVSLLMGWIFNFIWKELGSNVDLVSPHGEQLPHLLRLISGILLFLLILKGFFKNKKEAVTMKYELSVPDITCKHCKMTIENKLIELPDVSQVVVNLGNKTVSVDGDVSLEAVEKAIRDAGYTPERKQT